MEIETKICRLNDIFIFPFWKIRIEIQAHTRGPWVSEWNSYCWYTDFI